MSWKMTKEVREARLAGLLPGLNFTEFSVLLIMADTCRGESRVASISMVELEKLSGQKRTSMWRAVTKLGSRGHVHQLTRGNQFQTARYEVLPGAARCADATSTEGGARCAGATSTDGEHVAFETEHVAFETEHVAFEARARCAGATLPTVPDITIPTGNPGVARTRARTAEVPTKYIPILQAAQSLGGKNLTAVELAAEAGSDSTIAHVAMRFFEEHGIAVVVQKPAPGRYTAWSINGDWRVGS
jgi:hypothetical protein